MEKNFFKVDEIVNILFKRWKMVLGLTLLTTIVSIIISFIIISPKYKAITKLFVGKQESNSAQDQGYNNNDILMYQKLLKTYAEIIQTNDLISRAIDLDGLNVTPQYVLNNLKVTPRADTQILEISYINTDKFLTANIVNAVSNEFIKSVKELIPNGNVKVIESVRIPQNPVSPNKLIYVGAAFLLGLFLSIGLSFLLEYLDNTFKNKEELEKFLELPVLGTIPDAHRNLKGVK